MKIIFMATPNFAIPSLQKLIENKNFEVVGVYSRAPQKAGRGQKLTNSPIHEMALKYGLKVFTPNSLKDEKTQDEFKNLQADIALVVAYGLIIPKKILESTKFGIINIHPSILPKYRGATPIQSTILSGDDEIGVTIIKMDENVDSGDIISQNCFKIDQNHDDYDNLAPKLAEMGAKMAVEAIEEIAVKKAKFTPQNHEKATLCKKIAKNDAKIDFNQDAKTVLNQIRALNGFLPAFFEQNGDKIKIFRAKIVENDENVENGTILENFVIKCAKNAIQPLELQKAGRNRVLLADFLRGIKK
jgi:methionyl-tRNA formyltransferase